MSDKEILTLAIKKAHRRGYKKGKGNFFVDYGDEVGHIETEMLFVKMYDSVLNYEAVMFDTDFAVAFFGTKLVCSACGKYHKKLCGAGTVWMAHGEGMYLYALSVLASDEDNRFKYLEKFL